MGYKQQRYVLHVPYGGLETDKFNTAWAEHCWHHRGKVDILYFTCFQTLYCDLSQTRIPDGAMVWLSRWTDWFGTQKSAHSASWKAMGLAYKPGRANAQSFTVGVLGCVCVSSAGVALLYIAGDFAVILSASDVIWNKHRQVATPVEIRRILSM